jgi:GT2 family glycosyltransferase
MLRTAQQLTPDADLAALTVLTLVRLDQPEDACKALAGALSQYCVEAGGLLSCIAGMIVRHPGVAAPGWVGRGPRLELVGGLVAQDPSSVLQVRIDGRPPLAQLLRDPDRGETGAGDFVLPQFADASIFDISCRGVPLLGSGQRLPTDFALDGQTTTRGCCLKGWARIGWQPAQPPRVRVVDDRSGRVILKTARRTIGAHRWPFELHLRESALRGQRLQVEVRLPDGKWRSLPDSPLLTGSAVRLPRAHVATLTSWSNTDNNKSLRVNEARRAKSVDVIVPIYRGREESLACIDSVLATLTCSNAYLVVVDDATDDSGLAAALDAFAAAGRIRLIRNTENLGFVHSVNSGLALNPTHDAVILNSDTLVFADWLTRLREAAYSGPRVGTATPLSNNGSIASYPNPAGGPIDPSVGAAMDTLAKSLHAGESIKIPVGVGFCLYLRRDCLSETGSLDAGVFGKGYGEEVDFCLRARRRGWSHRLAADVFVYHAGGLSFGNRRTRLLERSQRLLNLRHPGYDQFIANFLTRDPIRLLRRKLDEQRLRSLEGRLILLVTSTLTGGVDRFVSEHSRSLRDAGIVPLLLRPVAFGDRRRCELWTDSIELLNLRYDIPTDLDSLMAVLKSLPLESVEIQHFLHLDARVIEAALSLRRPYDVFVHDYAWICPRVTLIDETGRYCGEPAIAVCRRCITRNGTALGEVLSVPRLRQRSGRWLQKARRVIAPSTDTAQRLQRHFGDLHVEVRPHGPPVARAAQTRHKRREIVRVALIGAIGRHKGYKVLAHCARNARSRRLPIEFVVIGYTEDDAPLLAIGNVFITGRYGEAEVSYLIDREEPDILWLPSVWPETWCYTLDHALQTGLPVVSFDLGAIAERLASVDGALRLPLTTTPARINDVFLEMTQCEAETEPSRNDRAQTHMSYAADDAKMIDRQSGEPRVNKTANGKQEQNTQEGLSASLQVLPLPPGLYLFSVKAATPVVAGATGELSLPAVHVGPGPGVPTEVVEFVGGPSTHGGWLFAKGDLLVTKVKGTGATLVLTSVRAPGGEVLSIKVERLEARAETDPAQQADGNATKQQTSGDRPISGNLRNTKSPGISALDDSTVRLAVGAHLRARGDMSFSEVPWAGRVAPGLWIESFSVRPLERFGAEEIEYKALTGSGFETPWISEDKMCGTKGMATPLLGFAIRLKPSPAAAAFDCEYSGYFASGLTVGPVRNGVPCRSSVASDPLEGIQVRLVKRSATMLPGVVVRNAAVQAVVEKKKTKRHTSPNRSVNRSTHSARRTLSRKS